MLQRRYEFNSGKSTPDSGNTANWSVTTSLSVPTQAEIVNVSTSSTSQMKLKFDKDGLVLVKPPPEQVTIT